LSPWCFSSDLMSDMTVLSLCFLSPLTELTSEVLSWLFWDVAIVPKKSKGVLSSVGVGCVFDKSIISEVAFFSFGL